jgi:2-desacetyl-2-hydroxyethyl bacteriochlorophyllide A dehydrogenase
MNLPVPLVMGHEFSGVIEEIGVEVTGFSVGDRVVGEHVVPCRSCSYCLSGQPNLCRNAKVIGLDLPGALAEFLLIPAELVYKIPDSLSFEEAALLEPLTIALYAIKKAGDLLDKNVAVIGQGPIGLLLDQVLHSAGANVLGIESQGHRLEFAAGKRWIDEGINPSETNVLEAVSKKFPDLLDVVFEAVGREATAEMALEMARKSGWVFLLGVFEELSRLDLMKIVKKELFVHGSWTCAFSFPEAIDLAAKGKIDLKSMITHRFSASRGAEAFDQSSRYIENRIKTVINFGDEE